MVTFLKCLRTGDYRRDDFQRFGQSYEEPVMYADPFPQSESITVVLTIAAILIVHFMPLPKRREFQLLRNCLQLARTSRGAIASQQLLPDLFALIWPLSRGL